MADIVDFDPAGMASLSLGGEFSVDDGGFDWGGFNWSDPGESSYDPQDYQVDNTAFAAPPPDVDTGSMRAKEKGFLQSIFESPITSAVAYAVNPALGKALSLANIASKVSSGNYVGAARQGLGMLGPVAGVLGNAAIDVSQNKNPMGTLGAGVGGYLGSQMGVPGAGTMLSNVGRNLGNQLAGAGSNTGGTSMNTGGGLTNGLQQGTSLDWETILPSLAQIYSSSRANSAEQAAASQAGSLGNLADLFGPNSATAQAMRQQIERRDAAAGRRSQYGPREVELAAALAKLQADAAPGIMNANTNAAQQRMLAAQHGYARKNQMLGTLLGVGKRNNWFGLSNMFNNNGVAPNYSEAYGTGYGPSTGYYGQAPSVTSNPQEVENLYGNTGGGFGNMLVNTSYTSSSTDTGGEDIWEQYF